MNELRGARPWVLVSIPTLLAGALPIVSAHRDSLPAPTLDVAVKKRVVVLGIDGLDPDILRETIERHPDRMRAFAALAKVGGIHDLRTTTPPQSPVAWSTFITGLDPGGHGIFDFIHRDPVTREPAAATVKPGDAQAIPLPGDWQLPLGGGGDSNRSGKAFWTILAEHGVPADIWRMPANFPVEESDGLSFSGMMTPAIDSAYGTATLYSSDPPAKSIARDGRIVPVREFDGVIDEKLTGPENPFKEKPPGSKGEHVTIPLRIFVDHEARAVAIDIDGRIVVLGEGQWSDFVHVSFPLLGVGVPSVAGIVRFHLRRIAPVFELYASPVNIDPIDPIAPVSEPKSASADLARSIGLYYTQGMPEDVNALKNDILTEREFMEQSDLVHHEGVRTVDYAFDHLDRRARGGFLFLYFSGVDLCSHMMWRHADAGHPNHDVQLAQEDSSSWSRRPGSTWKDVIADLYMRMDPVVARVVERAGKDALVIVMSDHGFATYRRKFSLNTWLVDEGYLVLKPGRTKDLDEADPAHESAYISEAVDWSKTRAYGVGFNALYLNLKGREKDDPRTKDVDESGIVEPGTTADALVRELKTKLEALRDGPEVVIARCDRAADVYHGERAVEAPDLVVGYNAGYGNSDEASLGGIPHHVLADNHGGTFQGNHLMAPEVVKGALLTNGVVIGGDHGLEDLTVEILKQYGIAPESGMRGHPVLQ